MIKTILVIVCLTLGILQTPMCFSDEVKEIVKKINDATDAINHEADLYDKNYLDNAKSLAQWRLNWEQFVTISDSVYLLAFLNSKLDLVDQELSFTRDSILEHNGRPLSPEIDYILNKSKKNLSQIQNTLSHANSTFSYQCDEESMRRIIKRAPLSTVISIVSPNIGTFPSLKIHPTLAVSITIDFDGNMSFNPDPYLYDGQGTDLSDKWQIPQVAATISAALYLQIAGQSASYGPAAVIAFFVYTITEMALIQDDKNKVADAVGKLRKAIDRVFGIQQNVFNQVNSQYLEISHSVCTNSYTESYTEIQKQFQLQLSEYEVVSSKLQKLIDIRNKYSTENGNWNEIECEIFGCDGVEQYYTLNKTEIVDLLVTNLR